jgi:hypothetical protein
MRGKMRGKTMQSYNHYYESKLKEMLHDNIERVTESLAGGYGVVDFAQYKFLVGQITGLKAAIELCDEAKDLADKALR